MRKSVTDELGGTLERGLTVLRTLAAHPGLRMRAGDLVRATGLARSTVDRIVTTLARVGYVRLEERDLLLAPRLMELGNAYLSCSGLPRALDDLAAGLADELDESVSVAVPDGDAARFVSQFTRRRTMSVAFRIGDLLPAERCAAGALFAAEWPEGRFEAGPVGFGERAAAAREAGWAVDDQLIQPGLIAVAVPVREPGGRLVCAVSVVSHTSRHTVQTLRERAMPSLLACATAMEAALAEEPPEPAEPTVPVAGAAEWSRVSKEELGPEFLQTLARGLAVLLALAAPGGLTLAAAARRTGLPRATVRRSLLTLAQLGYAAQARDGRRFVLLPRVLELGYARLSGLAFPDIVQPHLAELVERVRDSASVAVLSGTDVLYVARMPTVRIMSVSITVGTRFPAYATSMGRVLLAGLPRPELVAHLAGIDPTPLTPHTVTTRADLEAAVAVAGRDGYSLVDQELEEGLRSIAVPVHDHAGRVIAAVNVATHVSRGTPDDLRRDVLPALAEAAARIEADLAVQAGRTPEGPATGLG